MDNMLGGLRGQVPTKKETKNAGKKSAGKKNSGTDKIGEMASSFVEMFRNASPATRKEVQTKLEASAVVDDFIKNFRTSNIQKQGAISDNLAKAASSNGVLRDALGKIASAGPSGVNFDSTLNNIASSAARGNVKVGGLVSPLINTAGGRTLTDAERAAAEATANEPMVFSTEEGETVTTPQGNTASEAVEYTYQPGDNFGNVLVKMGLSDGRNLWGPDGDVAYYTKQLNDQGIYGNIPVGTTIRLRRRA